MSHPKQLAFVSLISRRLRPDWKHAKILEVGSYDVNGSIRKLFEGYDEYIGADLTAGPGVDIISSGHQLTYADETFDLTISCECFEHNPFWFETFANMVRMTKPGGLTAFTCASRGRLEHGTIRTDGSMSPGTTAVGINYYRNLRKEDFEKKMNFPSVFSKHEFFYEKAARDIYFVGIKRGAINSDVYDLRVIDGARAHEKSTAHIDYSFRSLYNLFTEQIAIDILSTILSEKQFQNVALRYLRVKLRIQNFFKRKLGKLAHS